MLMASALRSEADDSTSKDAAAGAGDHESVLHAHHAHLLRRIPQQSARHSQVVLQVTACEARPPRWQGRTVEAGRMSGQTPPGAPSSGRRLAVLSVYIPAQLEAALLVLHLQLLVHVFRATGPLTCR